VRDHTAILKFIERKWNLGALTFRDANADDLFDCLDFSGQPPFLEPPVLPAPALAAPNLPPCMPEQPGTIPPPEAVTHGPPNAHAHIQPLVSRHEAKVRMSEPLAEAWGKVWARGERPPE